MCNVMQNKRSDFVFIEIWGAHNWPKIPRQFALPKNPNEHITISWHVGSRVFVRPPFDIPLVCSFVIEKPSSPTNV